MLAFADLLGVAAVSAVLALSSAGVDAAVWAILSAPAWILLAKLFGLYDRDRRELRHLTADELQSVFLWTLTSMGVLTVFLQASPAGAPDVAVTGLCWAAAFGCALAFRGAARLLWRAVTAPERTVILGGGPLADAARRKVELFPDMHVELLGDAIDFTSDEVSSLNGHLKGVDRVIVASEALDEARLARLVAVCKEQQTRLSVVPPARGMFGTAVRLTHVAELPVVEYNTSDVSSSTLVLKRMLDLAGSVLGLIVLAPLLLAIGVALRVSGGGPAVFAQMRAGKGGRPFRMLKFRTMVVDAEAHLGEVVCLDALPEPVFKLRHDPRVTRLGRLLRRTSLDELPQLLNVVMGDMSLVGPRPEQLDLVQRYTPLQRFRLEVKPGLTGPMQVYGRGRLTLDERLSVEREYIDNLSITRDLKILALTVSAVVTGRGAF